MKKIGFIGAFDKADLILNISKILTLLGKKVLYIDATMLQKVKYIVPTISNDQVYITDFEGIDVAIGFNRFEQIAAYLNQLSENIDYDYVLIDTDNIYGFNKYDLKTSTKNYFVSSFDVYSLKKSLEVFSNLQDVLNITKVMYAKELLKEDDDYLNYLSLQYKIIWNETRLYFPYDNGDQTVIAENQRLCKIRFRRLSSEYKEGLAQIVQSIDKDESDSNIRRVIKFVEKGA